MCISSTCDEAVQDGSQALQTPLDERRQWLGVYTRVRWHRCLPRARELARAVGCMFFCTISCRRALRGNEHVTFPVQRAARTAAILPA